MILYYKNQNTIRKYLEKSLEKYVHVEKLQILVRFRYKGCYR